MYIRVFLHQLLIVVDGQCDLKPKLHSHRSPSVLNEGLEIVGMFLLLTGS